MVNEFQDQVVLITGAAGGIGAATAKLFAVDGARLALLDRNEDGLAVVAEEVKSRGAGEVLLLPVDQTNGKSVSSAIDEITSILGEIRVLFANAGYGQFSPFLTTSADKWERHVNVNMTGTFNVCQRVAQAMVSAGNGGSIILLCDPNSLGLGELNFIKIFYLIYQLVQDGYKLFQQTRCSWLNYMTSQNLLNL